MGNVLIVIEATPERTVRKASFNALAAGQQLAQAAGGELHAVVLHPDATALAEAVKVAGPTVVHAAASPAFEHGIAENLAPTIAALATSIGAGYVGAAATVHGRDLMPRVAAKLKAAMASDVLSIEGTGDGVVFNRPMWAGAVIATVKLTTAVKVFTARPTEFPLATGTAAAEVRPLAPTLPERPLTAHVSFKEVKSARPALTEARVVVSGGRGTKGDFKPIEGLADELNAAVGASRAVCDAGWQPNDLQVGQTGKVVAPALYIAAGISGAIQHVAGMKGSRTIVAINKDADAPIFQVADYGLVGDLFKLLPELTQAIKAAK